MSKLGRYRFVDGTAVLTGAASGMGEHMAYGLASRGSDLVLIDRDEQRLDEVATKIKNERHGRRVDTHVVDLADLAGLDAVAEEVLAAHPRITLLINNAGVALGGVFDQVSSEEFDWVMDINFRAPVVLTRLLLPRLRESPGSHIVNLSSVFGLIAPPGQSAYAASKFAIRGFSESLRHELEGQSVGVTTVHPGGVRTRIAQNARLASGVNEAEIREGKEAFDKLLSYPADKAAETILLGLEKRKARVLIAWSAVIPDMLARLFPQSYLTVMSKVRPPRGRNSTSQAASRTE